MSARKRTCPRVWSVSDCRGGALLAAQGIQRVGCGAAARGAAAEERVGGVEAEGRALEAPLKTRGRRHRQPQADDEALHDGLPAGLFMVRDGTPAATGWSGKGRRGASALAPRGGMM